MQVITADYIKKALRSVWPDIPFPMRFDQEYISPSMGQLKTALKLLESKLRKYQDCDNYALATHHYVVNDITFGKEFYMGERLDLTWAFGEVAGQKFRGWDEWHSCNICFVEGKIYLIEPQDLPDLKRAIWPADPQQDQIYFAKFN